MFAQAASGDRDLSEFGAHYAPGLAGPIGAEEGKGPRDEAGLYWSHVDVPGAFAPSHESSFDAYYRWRIDEALYVQPELFWFVDPGGRRDIGDATVLFLRVGLAL